jgi:adenylate cyclase
VAEERAQRRLAAILAADVVGYSQLMGEDEAGTLNALNKHRAEFIHPTVGEYRGRIVKLMGDGALVEFPSIVDAVECAVAVQRGMEERNADIPDSKRITFRIGINLGDIIIDGDDIYGDGVNVAARLEGLAEPGGICVSAKVFEEVGNKLNLGFEDLGPQEVKNIDEPVRAYRAILDRVASKLGTEPLPLPEKPSIAVLPFENTRVLLRRHHRRHHHGALEVPLVFRDRTQLDLCLQGAGDRHQARGARAWRALRAGRQRAQGR